MNLLLLGIFGYIAVQLLIGVLVSRRISDEADYLLAGRSLGPGLATFSVFATWFGAETCVGAAGSIYADGLSGGKADPFGYAVCLFLMGLFFAVPLYRRRLTTLADLFRERYSERVEWLAVILMVPASVLWAAAQMRAFGQVLTASSTFDVDVAITFAAAVIVIYTVWGGLFADAVTDVVQGVALIVGLAVLLGAILLTTGGPGAAIESIDPGRLQLFGGSETTALGVLEGWAIPICGSVLAQELVSRVLAARNPGIARRAPLIGGGLYLAVGLIPVYIGLVGAHLVPGLDDPERVLPLVAQQYLPGALYVLFAGALISAILSTVDSALLAAASLTSHNLLVPVFGVKSERTKVRMARAGVVAFGIVAYVIALNSEGVYALVESASAFGSAGVFTVGVFALFSRFGSEYAAGAALLAGMAAWIVGSYLANFATPYLFSLAAAVSCYIVVALLERFLIAAAPVAARR